MRKPIETLAAVNVLGEAAVLLKPVANVEPFKYSQETAPYFFEQIVDRLEEQDFPKFYELIRGKCPELMSVNTYVTGLIMFYAGQLAYKLIQEIVKSEDKHPAMTNWKPIVNIVFAGKGARIFDWFNRVIT